MHTLNFSTILKDTPWYCIVFAFLISIYHGYRGYILQKLITAIQKENYEKENHETAIQKEKHETGKIEKKWPMTERHSFCSRYIYDAFVQFFTSVIGFLTWWFLFYIINTTDKLSQISAGCSIMLIFLFTFGLLGITGHIPYIIQTGKFPFK